MTTFEDGPARGQSMELKRAPLLLRVCRKPDLSFDALDQIEDAPDDDETLIAYVRVRVTRGFVDYRGKDRAKSGPIAMTSYRMIEEQPPDAVMRDRNRWQLWCFEYVKKTPPG